MAFARDPGLNQYKARFYDDMTPGAVSHGINPALDPVPNYAPPAATGPGGAPQPMHESGHYAAPPMPEPSSRGFSQGVQAGDATAKNAPTKSPVQELDDYIARESAKRENPNISEEDLAKVTRKSRMAEAKARTAVKSGGTAVGSAVATSRASGRRSRAAQSSTSGYSNGNASGYSNARPANSGRSSNPASSAGSSKKKTLAQTISDSGIPKMGIKPKAPTVYPSHPEFAHKPSTPVPAPPEYMEELGHPGTRRQLTPPSQIHGPNRVIAESLDNATGGRVLPPEQRINIPEDPNNTLIQKGLYYNPFIPNVPNYTNYIPEKNREAWMRQRMIEERRSSAGEQEGRDARVHERLQQIGAGVTKPKSVTPKPNVTSQTQKTKKNLKNLKNGAKAPKKSSKKGK